MKDPGEFLSSRDRGRRKEVIRIIKGEKRYLVNNGPTRFSVALVVLGRPDVGKAAAIADVDPKEAEVFALRLRDSRMIHRDRLDLSGFSSGFPDRGEAGGSAVNMALVAMVCAGELTRHKPCKHCGKPVARAGYGPGGVQRWRCRGCGKQFVYELNPLERMRVPWENPCFSRRREPLLPWSPVVPD